MPSSPLILTLPEIKEFLPQANLFEEITRGFVAYSKGEAVIPPVGELLIPESEGEVHIKYGYIESEPYYVVKIASGFYANTALGLPTGNGLMLLFDKENGKLLCILQDEGYLTDVRTAVAGALAASHLAPETSKRIGIVGTGIQAHLQLEYLARVWDIEEVKVWGRDPQKAQAYVSEMAHLDLAISSETKLKSLCTSTDIILTTTPSKEPLIKSEWIEAPKCIVAIGSDTPEKIELESHLFKKVRLKIVDSRSQSQSRGELFQARKAGIVSDDKIFELGELIKFGRPLLVGNKPIITLVDLTGVAVQDLMIAKAVYELANPSNSRT